MAIIILKDGSNGEGRKCTLRCDVCKRIYYKTYVNVVRAKHHFCCLDCRREWEKDIKNQPAWQGGEIKRLGYVFIKVKDHPRADILGYVKRSRLVMEELLGRYLNPEETMHHINGDRSDDRSENLMLFKNNGKHQIYHWQIRKSRKQLQLDLT